MAQRPWIEAPQIRQSPVRTLGSRFSNEGQISGRPTFAKCLCFISCPRPTGPRRLPVPGLARLPVKALRGLETRQGPSRVIINIRGEPHLLAVPQSSRHLFDGFWRNEAALPLAELRPWIGIENRHTSETRCSPPPKPISSQRSWCSAPCARRDAGSASRFTRRLGSKLSVSAACRGRKVLPFRRPKKCGSERSAIDKQEGALDGAPSNSQFTRSMSSTYLQGPSSPRRSRHLRRARGQSDRKPTCVRRRDD